MMKRPLTVLSALFSASLYASLYALLSAWFAVALPVFAALGGAEDSVVADQVKFQAKRRVVPERGYSVHEISRDDGALIREYVSPAGKVFGVSWKGPSLPDLSQLLGSNFVEFKNSLHPKPGRRRVAVVRNSDLVVESAGHTRAFYGRAYLNSLLPSGVTQEIVQ
jgi:uncharacterized protein DUF2844